MIKFIINFFKFFNFFFIMTKTKITWYNNYSFILKRWRGVNFNKTQNQKRAYIYAESGTTVYVKGGNFGEASTRSGYTAGILGEGTVIITGGSFGFDPSAWVASGYTATENNGVWTVSAN